MTKLIQPAVVAAVLLALASSAMAHTAAPSYGSAQTTRNPTPAWADMSKPYGGYDPNSPEGNRAFWDYQARHGGSGGGRR